MRWTKDKYELTIRDVSLLFERDDISVLNRFKWIPGFILRRYYAKFMLEFAEMFNSREVSNLIDDDIFRLKVLNRINNILAPLYIGLMMNENHPEFRKMYEEVMFRRYNGKEDLKFIIKEIERLKSKLAERGTPVDHIQGKEKLSFEQVIANTEMILERSLPRDMKLFEFKKQYDLAIARAKEFEKLKQK